VTVAGLLHPGEMGAAPRSSGHERRLAAAEGQRRRGLALDREMQEIAAAFAADGLPPGFHTAAAAIFERSVSQS